MKFSSTVHEITAGGVEHGLKTHTSIITNDVFNIEHLVVSEEFDIV